MLKAFRGDEHLTITFVQATEPSADGEVVLLATDLHFSPQANPGAWLQAFDIDALTHRAEGFAKDALNDPVLTATMWTQQARRGRTTRDQHLQEVVDLRSSMSVAEIAKRIGRSESQVFRYLKQARERGITASEQSEDGAR